MIPPVESADKTLQWEKACFVTCYLHLFCNLNIKESKEQKTTKPTFTLINCVVTIIKWAGLYTANMIYTLLFVLLFVNYKLCIQKHHTLVSLFQGDDCNLINN